MWKVEHGQLPPRQAETLEGIAKGMTDKEIAKQMGISPGAVHRYVDTLFYKLKLSTGRRALLVANAIQQGVLTSTAALLLFAICVNTIAQADIEMRRSSTRLSTRVSARTTRPSRYGRKDLWGASELGLEVDFEELAA
jgi:DNA-binding CsgD family transcriptional regulator